MYRVAIANVGVTEFKSLREAVVACKYFGNPLFFYHSEFSFEVNEDLNHIQRLSPRVFNNSRKLYFIGKFYSKEELKELLSYLNEGNMTPSEAKKVKDKLIAVHLQIGITCPDEEAILNMLHEDLA